MDFFQAQQNARRKTAQLVFLFVAAVVSLIVMTYTMVMALQAFLVKDANQYFSWQLVSAQFDWHAAIFVACIVSLIIFSGSAYKSISLGAGGKKIAELLGGKRITHDTRDSKEKQLLNVVEEMAIASGTPVPGVYVLDDEHAINAFAAGYRTSDAVIGVTRGSLDLLSRQELQGVIAHEFSHLLNGDTRLNMRLIGILHGILIIGYIGYYLLRTIRGNDKNAGAILGLGLALVVIGFSGNFFGGLIKAAVSRQREYLADASAVQFTRSKEGIAGALSKIRQSQVGSQLSSPLAPQMSHAYFSQGVSTFVDSLFATHPPLARRIKRISPHFEIQQKINRQNKAERAQPQTAEKTQDQATDNRQRGETLVKTITAAAVAQQAIDSIGQISDQQLDYAHQLLLEMPVNVLDAVRNRVGAQAVIYGLLLDSKSDIKQRQLNYLQQHCSTELTSQLHAIDHTLATLHPRFRLPLIDMSIPLLQTLAENQYRDMLTHMQVLIDSDQHVALSEWVLLRMIRRHVGGAFEKANRVDKQHTPSQCYHSAEVLFSALLHHLVDDQQEQQRLLPLIKQTAEMPELNLLSKTQCQFNHLDQALSQLVNLQVQAKPNILKACLLIATSDKLFTHQEMELVRAIADTLDCPMPPNLSAN
ncbi:M48 family metallopeptidase [Thalassotalea ponticola]|uniref:M48 family metallopeptidase n=1 Tax=Thalassotalea ponticola TaxID=1523392 RepID=UPI0025B57317|nr:M48 family metallopeptidase [Thalassotalea ponticola]MDN3652801.1 M48 family metallopeptidase [Thalassotalea ponticola]